MLEIIKAIIYGIVEGITEWLPISSTGHLILVERLIPFKQTSEGFFDMFDVVQALIITDVSVRHQFIYFRIFQISEFYES